MSAEVLIQVGLRHRYICIDYLLSFDEALSCMVFLHAPPGGATSNPPLCGWYLISRGDRREPIFHDDEDKLKFLCILAEVVGRCTWKGLEHFKAYV